MKDNYNEKSIQVLEGLEAVRKRPGMYIGNIDKKGLHHLIWEIMDNSIDEALAGYATKISILLRADNSVIIEDNGRGIPIEKHPKTKKSTVETVYTILHAGGKFGGENSGYKVSGGLHGVGASVVNALSSYLIVNVYKGGYEYEIQFHKGGKVKSKLREIGNTEKRGTKVHFLPDFALFNEDVKFDSETIKNRLKETAYLNKGLEIKFKSEFEPNKAITYKFDGGILDFIIDINKSKEKISTPPFYIEKTKDNISVELSFQYVNTFQQIMMSYVNNIITVEGGTHELGFFDSLSRILSKYSKDHLSKKDYFQFTRDDIKEGLVTIISIKHPNPMYEGQTKNKFANLEVRKIVNELISESLENYLLENPDISKKILEKISLSYKARISATKARELVRRKDLIGFSTLPGKLADCSSKDRSKTELFIVEGDSAGGSAKMGRDREIQAILPLRGKIINAERSRLDKLIANNEISSLITALGTGIEQDFDIEKLRYDKIIIMTDADVDGSHIRTLLLTFFYRYFKNLIDNGYIYIAQPPLYKITSNRKSRYIYDDTEKDKYLKKFLNNENKKYTIQRYKGLGEMNYDQLWDTTMNPEHRSLLRVSIEDARKAEEVFEKLMGENVEPRRNFIISNAKYAKLDI